MTKTVKIAVFDGDLKAELKNYPLSKSGNKINIVAEGAGYFMPEIGPTNFLDWPSTKRFVLFGSRTYKRIYFARKKAKKCVDFGREEGFVYGPDEEQMKRANMNLLAEKIGSESQKGVPWYAWITVGLSVLNFIILLQMSGVIR